MAERLRQVRFSCFRGLPNNFCDLKDRNLLICGGNGSGKSAIVDGIEFAFGGFLSRFRGTGSGGIQEDQAIGNVLGGSPTVSLSFMPSKETITRVLGQYGSLVAENDNLQEHLRRHPVPGSFILRRSQLLDFIFAQDAPRYQTFVRLLGLDHLDQMQQAFNDAHDRTALMLANALREHNNALSVFRDPVSGATPTTIEALQGSLMAQVEPLGLTAFQSWDDLPGCIAALEARRSPENRIRIDALNRLLLCLSAPLPDMLMEDIESLNALQQELDNLRRSSEEAQREAIIHEAIPYAVAHPDMTRCPLCEKPIDMGYEALLSRLRERHASLQRLRQVRDNYVSALGRITRASERIAQVVTQDLSNRAFIPEPSTEVLERTLRVAAAWHRLLASSGPDSPLSGIVLPQEIAEIASIRAALTRGAQDELQRVVPRDAAALETALRSLQLAAQQLPIC